MLKHISMEPFQMNKIKIISNFPGAKINSMKNYTKHLRRKSRL